MNQSELDSYFISLCNKYPEVSPSILQDYKPAKEYEYYHEYDLDLQKIRVELPSPPSDHKLIQNFGKPANEQKWSPPVLPKRLKQLQNKITSKDKYSVNDFWDELYKFPRKYRKEIKFIRREQARKVRGHWVYINGTPTYITGWNYFYLSYWRLDIGLPKYRSRDRKFFTFAKYCYTTTETIVYEQKEGIKELVPKLHPDGTCVMRDTGHRTCYGFNYPKHRREGATFKAACVAYCIITEGKNRSSGFQSMDKEHGSSGFLEKYVEPFWNVPLCFWPNVPRVVKPQGNKLKLESLHMGDKSLGGLMSHALSAKRGFYDGDKLYFYHDDETGKTTEENVYDRAFVTKKCLVVGSDIVGFTIKTSTVGQMEAGGGINFKDLCDQSHFEKRNANGETVSGYFNLFIPAEDGYEGFVDAFGDSVIETPTKEQKAFIKRDIGAREYLQRERDTLKDRTDEKSKKAYDEIMRMTPSNYRDCFRSAGGDIGFDRNILNDRINYLTFEQDKRIRGNYVLDKNMISRFEVDMENGRFFVTKQLEERLTNRRFKAPDGMYYPINEYEYVSSSDPFKFEKTQSNKMSDAGFALYWMYDHNVDGGKERSEWLSDRFIVSYNNRPEKKEMYYEDVLACILYWGGVLYPENNVPGLYEYILEKGFGGYLLYEYDNLRQEYKVNPGFFSSPGTKESLFSEVKTHIKENGHRQEHVDILKEMRDIQSIQEMTKYDLFTAAGGCLLGRKEILKITGKLYQDGKSVYEEPVKAEEQENRWF